MLFQAMLPVGMTEANIEELINLWDSDEAAITVWGHSSTTNSGSDPEENKDGVFFRPTSYDVGAGLPFGLYV
jgi:hypothetical protein